MTTCECTVSGWCRRHRCGKTEHLRQLCRTRPDYFRLWEEGRGPGQHHSLREPGLLRKVLNFWWALCRFLANRRRQVRRAVYQERLAICRECPSLDGERMVCREKQCGCKVERKAWWASEDCPIGKWPRNVNRSDDAVRGRIHDRETDETVRQAATA